MRQLRLLISHALLSFVFPAVFYVSSVSAQIPGSPAPDFTLTDLHGSKVSLSGLRGNVVIMNFWATWCGPCKAEMPSLHNLYTEYKSKGLAVVAISIDATEKPVISFIEQKKLAFPVLIDKNKEVYFDSYAGMGLPETFIIDRKGIVIEKIMGEQEWDSPRMKERILKYLTGR
ncbi:MAG: redoxin domain-containing protein [Nitrospirae bacterium]|nr:redoxin domain-containing protein [Nitrospirota bacterium]